MVVFSLLPSVSVIFDLGWLLSLPLLHQIKVWFHSVILQLNNFTVTYTACCTNFDLSSLILSSQNLFINVYPGLQSQQIFSQQKVKGDFFVNVDSKIEHKVVSLVHYQGSHRAIEILLRNVSKDTTYFILFII